MSDLKHICNQEFYFERGRIKKAYNVKMCDTETESSFTSDKEITQLCIVFMDKINWITPSTTKITEYGTQLIKFKTKQINDTLFKYNIRKLIDNHIADNPQWHTTAKDITISDPNKYLEEFNEINNLDRLINWFEKYDKQFDYINEIKKLNELGKLGLAPKLYQIRINNDAPFSPDEIDEKIKDIPDEKSVQISYLVEKCGMNIAEFISQNLRNTSLKDLAIRRICEFSDDYVERTKGVNCDLKFKNLCSEIVNGEIKSIRLLDVDPIYSVEEKGNPDFVRHAKVFMKFFIFAHLFKQTGDFSLPYLFFHNNFTFDNKINCVLNSDEVSKMIVFFYDINYMIYEFNPIIMMYHYLIKKHPLEIKKEKEERQPGRIKKKVDVPKYENSFLNFDILKSYFTDEEIITVFKNFIMFVPPPPVPVVASAKGGKKRKSRKSNKSRKSRKSRK